MADNLDDGEFWLPSHFLTDDDILMDFTDFGCGGDKKVKKDAFEGLESFRLGLNTFGLGSTGPNSDLSSPVESVNGSTETESDEDFEFLSSLTHQLARSTLDDSFTLSKTKNPTLSTSPQSTLCSVGGGVGFSSGCDCKNGGGSSRGSPTGAVSPPPLSKKIPGNDAALDLLYAAAGEMVKMRKTRTEEGTGFFDSSNREALLSGARKPITVSPLPVGGVENPNGSVVNYHGFYPPRQPVYQHQLQASQIQQMMMKQQRQVLWEQQQLKSNVGQFVNGGSNTSNCNENIRFHPLNLSPSAWPPLQPRNFNQQNQRQPQRPVPGSAGMRAVFLDTPGSKRECAGTGVFLPRRVGGITNESRKKPACSSATTTTVLLPAKVVHALNNINAPKTQFHPCLNNDGPMRYRSGGINGNSNGFQRKNNNRAQATVADVAAAQTNYEIQLPEWTY